MTPEAVKRKFKQNGWTFAAWAKEHGYTPVLNGFAKGDRGKAHEIALKLGLKKPIN